MVRCVRGNQYEAQITHTHKPTLHPHSHSHSHLHNFANDYLQLRPTPHEHLRTHNSKQHNGDVIPNELWQVQKDQTDGNDGAELYKRLASKRYRLGMRNENITH